MPTTMADRQSRQDIIAWVGSNIVPLEAGLRVRLSRLGVPEAEIGDIVQDAYVAIARLDSVAHIRDSRSYFYATARNALFQRLRRERIVRIDSLTDAQALGLADEYPGPERHASAQIELARVRRLIDGLPDRCREIFVLRRIHGVAQREIAARLGLSEKIVEAQAIRGLKMILKAIEREDNELAASQKPPEERRQTDDSRR